MSTWAENGVTLPLQPDITPKYVIDPPVHQRIACQCHILPRTDVNITRLYERAVPAGGNKANNLGLGNKIT